MFTKQYPSAKIITLTDSYRSGTHILTASHALMSAGGIHPDRNPLLTSQHPEPHHATVTTHAFTTEEYELSWVVEQIAAFIKKGVAPQEIAVLYRNNKDAEVISRFLARASVPHIISTSQDALAHHTMQQLLTFCKACFDTYADRAVAESLFAPWSGLSEGDIHRIVRSARVTHKPYIEILHDLKKVEGIVNTDSVSAFYTLLVKASRVAREQHARDFMSFVLNECGFLKYILSHESAADMLGRVRGLLGVLERHAAQHVGYSTKQFLDDVALYIAYKIPIIKDMPTPTSLQSVRLMTAHGSKGLEFSHVFIVHARDKKWGNTRGRNAFYIPGLEADTDDDERRLLYVALTRAKDAAHLTHASKTIEGNEALPSVFIQDIAAHTTAVQTEQFEAGYAPHASLVAPPRGIPVEDKAFLRALFVDQGLSVTALNNYLVCPWRYFYRNLVRMPDIPNNYLLYGNGVHQGIKEFFDMRTEKALPNKAKLISLASNALTTQGFDVTGLSEAQIRAKDHLSTWYDERKGTWNDVQSISELPIEMMLSIDAPSLSRVLIRGVIDRLDAHTDGTLRVVDYKTGRPKTRNEILGDTKNSTGDYFRQLVFYGLYLKEQGRGSVHESCIDFLEPDTKGRHRYESFDISQNEIEALRVVIASTAEAIYTLSFFDKHCDDDACEYCELRRSLQ
jgi:DNA helicase-2/ATP-dependent DNA helicase PcrA